MADANDDLDVLVINLQRRESECALCGKWNADNCGIPVVNGDPVSNEFPDWIWGQHGGGVGVCRDCHDRHARGEVETYDDCYTWLGRGFIDGGGI